MQPVDGQDANMLAYYKKNSIPHTYQCSKCGTFMGVEPPNKPDCTHRWIIRDISKLTTTTNGAATASTGNGNHDETGHRDNSLQGGTVNTEVHPTLPGQGTGNLGPEFD